MNWPIISPEKLLASLKTDKELAFVDVREQGIHAQGHPLFAIPLPLSRLELEVERLIPCKSIAIYLLDQGEGDTLAKRAADKLREMSYTDISIVGGGLLGWHAEGLEVFSGVNVPSKAFGEWVESKKETPHISAEELKERLDAGDDIAILDSRPLEEYQRMCIPGGIDMPGAELVHRVFEAVPDEGTLIVVNCAGRTRSIIGAQSLRDAGVKNPIMALKDGTMGWYLAGFELENKAGRVAGEPTEANLDKAVQAAQTAASRADVLEISAADLKDLQSNQNEKILYILDVRSKEEFQAGHVKGSQHSPGGQLVQATDEYVAVRNSTLVLVDDKRARALMTASWLKQMGWNKVCVLFDLSNIEMEIGNGFVKEVEKTAEMTAFELDAVLSSGEPIAVIDLANSLAYRDKHIPSAYWAIRSRLAQDMIYLPPVGFIIVTADDVRLAHLAAKEIAALKPQIIVRVLQNGNQSWYDAGLRVEEGEMRPLSEKDDLWYKPYDNKEKIKERMQGYLDWEVALIGQVARDGTARFRIFDE